MLDIFTGEAVEEGAVVEVEGAGSTSTGGTTSELEFCSYLGCHPPENK